MFEQNLESLLKQITLQSIASLVGGNSDITNLLLRLDGAASRRQIVDRVQFENAWQCQLDGSDIVHVLFEFKLSPSLCAVAYDNGDEINATAWSLAIPNINYLDDNTMPKNAIDYLALGKVVELEDDDGYTYSCLSKLLDSTAH